MDNKPFVPFCADTPDVIEDIAPCPFCGSENVTIEEDYKLDEEYAWCPFGYFLVCHGCLMETGVYSDADDLISKWNRRV